MKKRTEGSCLVKTKQVADDSSDINTRLIWHQLMAVSVKLFSANKSPTLRSMKNIISNSIKKSALDSVDPNRLQIQH